MKHQTKIDAKTLSLSKFMLENPGKDIVITERECTADLVEIMGKLFDLGISPTVEPKEMRKVLLDIYQIYNVDMDKTIEHIVKGVKE